jgi:murein DD-endopeptidase MepM/ murein hydrolase activator NlpD
MRKGFIITVSSGVLIYLTIFYLFVLPSYKEKELEADIKKANVEIEIPKLPVLKYGIAVDSLEVLREKIKRNETLEEILLRYNIPASEIGKLALKPESKELKTIHAGNYYTVYQTRGTNPVAKCIIYEANPSDNIILKYEDSLQVIFEHREQVNTQKNIGVEITSSLYESVAACGASPDLAQKLAQIFSSQVDFFKINKGDNFKVIYDQKSIDGKTLETGKIYSACFEHNKEKFYAFCFTQDGKDEYFDENGQSLSKGGFLKAPLKFFRISSRFTKRRFHPVQKIFKAHLGTDYAAPSGTPILTVGNGTIVEAQYSVFNGNYVKVKHDQTYTTQYLHMSKIAKGMKRGKKVSKGEVIGYVGSTGLATGPHLCFRFWKNGKQIDGTKVKIMAHSEPINRLQLATFEKVRNKMLGSLNQIKIDTLKAPASLSMK